MIIKISVLKLKLLSLNDLKNYGNSSAIEVDIHKNESHAFV